MIVRMRVADCETSGLKRADGAEVVEWGWVDLLFDTETKAVEISLPQSLLFYPENGMPPEVSAVHHLTLKHLAGQPVHRDEDAGLLITSESPTFISAHNFCQMEAQWLTPELLGSTRAIDTLKCAAQIWPEAPSVGNQALRYWLGLDLDEETAAPPHRAGPDAWVTAHILARMLQTETVKDLVLWTMQPRKFWKCPIGKHYGEAWADIPHSYLTWITGNGNDLEPDIKAAAQDEINRRRDHQT